jgi:hypothetical protein
MTTEIHSPETAPAAPAPVQKLTWREKRWLRRRRRQTFEEILGWILVPVIVVAGYWALTGALEAAGTSLPALIQGIQTVINAI